MKKFAFAIALCMVSGIVAFAQGQDWMTAGADAQRSSWVRYDAKISKETVKSPEFQFLWKLKVDNQPNQMNALMPPATLERLIGYRGFRMLGFFAGSSNRIFTIDTDLGRMEWERNLAAPSKSGTMACPGGMTNGVVRPMTAAIPPMPSGGRGRSTPARSAVGEPGQGAVTLARIPPPRPAAPAPAPPRPAAPPRPNPANPPGGQFGAGPFLVHALSGDGMFHSMHLSNGENYQPPVRFLPDGANSSGLIVVENFAYAVTSGNCGGAANGLWAMDLESKKVTTWKANVAGSSGPAFDGKGGLFVATGSGGELSDSIVALDSKSLTAKGWYSSGGRPFVSSPVVFSHKGRILVAAAAADGRIHLVDGDNPGGADHKTAVAVVAGPAGTTGELTSWQDAAGDRFILAAAGNAVIAWKAVEQGGSITLSEAWRSRELASPLAPTIINGVAFVVSSGEFSTTDAKMTAAERARRSKPAVVYALDAATGRELWNSGTTITSFVHGGGISGGMGQIYLGTHDGTIYAFGFPMEH